MTALKDFVRLESTGLWRASAGDQRRDVYVFLGDAALTIVDQTETPLSHWSLPAVTRLNPGQRPALYAPDGNSEETLEITDPDMIDAINRVQRAVRRGTPHPGRVRLMLAAAVVLATVLLAAVWLPGALRARALAVLPPAKVDEIGARLQDQVLRLSGPVCRNPDGTAVLQDLVQRLFPAPIPAVTVLDLDATVLVVLPGRRILVDRDLIETQPGAAVLAGVLLVAQQQIETTPPIDAFLARAGVTTSMALLTTGDVTADALRVEAERLARLRLGPRIDPIALAPYFAAAGVPLNPLLVETGRAPLQESDTGPVLDDTSWIALQQVCG